MVYITIDDLVLDHLSGHHIGCILLPPARLPTDSCEVSEYWSNADFPGTSSSTLLLMSMLI
jgi:hypothetical protein